MGGRDLGAVGRARGNLRCDVAHLRESVGGGEGGWRVAPWPVMVARGWWEGEGGKKEA
jgi:hypothetical protein